MGAGNPATATAPDSASAGKAQCSEAMRGTEGTSRLAFPRMRGAIPSGRGAMPKIRGAVLALPATTIPYPASANDTRTDRGEGTSCLVLPRMGGAVGASAPSRATPRMRRVVPDPDALHSIDDMTARLGLAAAVRDRAKEVFRKLEHANVFPRGGKCRNRHALYAACLHVACHAEGMPRTFKELASTTGGDTTIKDIGRLIKHIKTHFGEEDVGGQAARDMMKMDTVVQAGDYVRRFGSLVGIGDQEVSVALEAARRVERNLDVRRSPDSIAAAVIYMAVQRGGAGKSFLDVSTATGVSEVTIKDVYYRDLSPHAKLLFD